MAENECENAVDLGDTTAKSKELMPFRPTRQELITLGLYHLERHFDALELAQEKERNWGYRESVFSWERFLQIRAIVGKESIFEEAVLERQRTLTV